MIVVAFCILASAVSLEAVIVSTALPSIKRDLDSGSSTRDFAWIGSAYLLASTSMLPVWARLSDMYGRRAVLIAADVFFVAGSVIAGMANRMTVLLIGRAIQGVGGGGLQVLINICTTDMFGLRERGVYIAIFGAVSAITASAAPVLGGWFAQDVSWRWCFWINVPLGMVSMILIAIFLRIEIPKSSYGLRSIDWLGIVTVAGGAVVLLVGLQMGGVNHPWSSALVLGLILGGCATLCLFVFSQWKISAHPLMPSRILRPRSNIAYLFVCFCHGFTYISVVYYLPVYFQLVLNASPIQSGVWLLATALSMGLGAVVSGIVIKRTGRYLGVIWISAGLSVLGFALFITLSTHRDWPRILGSQVLIGLGLGPLFQAPLVGLLAQVSKQDIASANALFVFLRSLGSAISIVIGQVLIQNCLRMQSSNLLNSGVAPSFVDKLTGDFTHLSGQAASALPMQQMEVIRNAMNSAMRSIWILYTVVAFVASLSVNFISRENPVALE